MDWRAKKRLIVAVFSAAPLVAAAVGTTTASDPRMEQCGAGRDGNAVIAAFDLATGAELLRVLPHMGDSPELERDTNSAFVVVFADGYVLPPMSGIGDHPREVDGVVCVVHADGDITLYSGVSRSGFVPPSR